MSSGHPCTWVVGARGLLGQHVVTELEARGHEVITWPVPWADQDAAVSALGAGLSELFSAAASRPWNIAWCAGAGVVASPGDVLAEEGRVFSRFIGHLGDELQTQARDGRDIDGALFMASSAGGLYAGSSDPPFSESTLPQPLSAYGHLKLAMERELVALSRASGLPVLIGRIANLYGPGQRIDKGQGLITQLCKAHLTRSPMSVYVSLDTIRDYIAVADCAAMVGAGLDGLRDFAQTQGDPVVVKLLASGSGTTIAGVIGECTRILRRRPPVVLATSPAASTQVRDLRLRSQAWPALDSYVRTPLGAGIALTARDVGERLREATT